MSDIGKPAITTSLGPLSLQHRAAATPPPSRDGTGDKLTTFAKHQIEHLYDRADTLTRHSEAHFAKHRDKWIDRQYGILLKSAGMKPEPAPPWAQRNVSNHLHRAATNLVDHRQYKRQRNIQRIMMREIKQVTAQSIGRARTQRNNKQQDQGR
jgi:hypothetical protein